MALNNLQNEAYKNRMTPEEKSAMKAQIFGVPTVAPHTSPYFHFSFQFFSTRVLAPLAVVFLISSGTTYAAEGALPGDTLYPVKVYVNESVVLSLARTPEAKAEAHASLAERRVEEAQALAAEGRLDATTTEALAVEVEAHVEEAEVRAAEAEEVESGKSRQVRAKLAATLDTGARVLVRIGADKDEKTKESSEVLSMRLLARVGVDSAAGANVRAMSKMAAPASDMATQTMSLMVASESTTTAEEDPTAQKAAAMLEHEAVEALADAREILEDTKETFDTETITEIEKQFSSVKESMSRGSASLGAGAYMQASEDFSAALRLAIKLQKLLEAHKKFDTNIVESLLWDEYSEDNGSVQGASTEEGGASTSLPVEIRGEILPKVID